MDGMCGVEQEGGWGRTLLEAGGGGGGGLVVGFWRSDEEEESIAAGISPPGGFLLQHGRQRQPLIFSSPLVSRLYFF
jgi:hypothetical protein